VIIIPEIETVVILVPRTGSGTLRRALHQRYPSAMLVYRHMEADGIPIGYDRWPRIGVVRNPLDRMWSLYKFLQRFDGDHDPAYIRAMHRQVDRPFGDWLLHNEVPFTSPYDRAHRGRYWPQFTVRHAIPENRKSAWIYLRPDLGTHVVPFDDLPTLWTALDLAEVPRANRTESSPPPALNDEADDYIHRVFAWDFKAAGGGHAG